jgi:Rieske Fe-S protein
MVDDTEDDDAPKPGRRRFLKVTCGALLVGVGAAVGGPVFASFLAPRKIRTVTGGGEPMDYGKLEEVPIGVPQKRDVVAETRDAWDRSDAKVIGALWLVRHADHVGAYSAVCPHLGCSIGFDAGKQVFYSPCHDSAFAKDDGAWLKGPAPRGMDPLPLEIKDGRIVITYKRFVLGIKQRRET